MSTTRKTKTIHVYVPVCVTLVVDAKTGELVSDGATGAYVEFLSVRTDDTLLGAKAQETAGNVVTGALEALDYPDAEMHGTEDA